MTDARIARDASSASAARLLAIVMTVAVAAASPLGAQAPASPGTSTTPVVSPRDSILRDSAAAASKQAGAAYGLGTRAGLEESIRLFAQAAGLYDRAGAAKEQGGMLTNVATLNNNLGRADSALVYYARAIALLRAAGDTNSEGAALRLLGETEQGIGRVDSALVRYRRALDIARSTGAQGREGLALNNIGIAYHDLARPDSAVRYLTQSLAIRRTLGDRLGESVTLSNLARVQQTLGRFDAAIDYLRESITASRAAKNRAAEGNALNNLGYAFDLRGDADSALAYYRDAATALEESGRRSTLGLTLVNIGRIHLTAGAPDSALASIRAGLAIKRDVGDRNGEAWALDDLGRVQLALGQPDSAFASFTAALALLRTVGDGAREGRTLASLGDAYRAHAELRRAAAYYDSAAVAIATVGSAAGGDGNRVAYAEQSVLLFEHWTLLSRAQAAEVGAPRAASAALAASERGRAQALLELMRSGARAQRQTARAPATTPAGRDLGAEGDTLLTSLRRQRNAMLSYVVGRDTLLVWLLLPAGELRLAAHAVGRDSVTALVTRARASLRADAARGRMAQRPSARTVRATAASRSDDATPSVADADAALQALATLLLPADFVRDVPSLAEVVVVPHAVLALVPFASLPLPAGAGPLGIRYGVRYAPSLAALAAAEAPSPAATNGGAVRRNRCTGACNASAVVVGNPAMPWFVDEVGDSVRLGPLPAAQVEASWVATRLRTRALRGVPATETAVRRLLPDARLVHLATHGLAFGTEARARDSYVALAPDAANDGLLTVGELLDDPAIALSAELVVLSACQTGLGDLKQAEGTMGLQRAFLAKGARSVLVSLWSVDDEATALLMRRFYTHWLGAPTTAATSAAAPTAVLSKAEALRRAQSDVRADARFAHPRYWAAFQLVGAR